MKDPQIGESRDGAPTAGGLRTGGPLFALDIGTRGVIGMLYRVGEDCELLFSHAEEHSDRAMLDGQIHDVEAVARVISRIRSRLEELSGTALGQVAVAAAGRSLKTVEAAAEVRLDGEPCPPETVSRLELDAVRSARSKLAQTHGLQADGPVPALHCVGYSVRTCHLDGSPIGSLIGQRGMTARLSLIATFLPRMVMDSLDAALTQAGLVMRSLTLEPIAALNALVPSSMRKLNIALVDIGAGTSDIAITADGTVLAYGMVPIAGDEVTEALAQSFLLDFGTAETVKRALGSETRVRFQDILGNPVSLSSRKVTETVRPAIAALADAVAAEILRLNGRSPTAVMLIGGGAKTPLAAGLLAQALGLTPDRVRIRDRESLSGVRGCEETLSGPESVTPIGIALASEKAAVTPVTIHLGGASRRLFSFRNLTVREALEEAGIDPRILSARPGSGISVQANGETVVIPGAHGTPGELTRNGARAALDEKLEPGDAVGVRPGKDGADARVSAADVLPSLGPASVVLNGSAVEILPMVWINGEPAHPRSWLRDRDSAAIAYPSVRQVIEARLGWPAFHDPISLRVNEKEITLSEPFYRLQCAVPPDGEAVPGLRIDAARLPWTPSVSDALAAAGCERGLPLRVCVNGQWRAIGARGALQKNGQPCTEADPVREGDRIVSACADGASGKPRITVSAIAFQLRESLQYESLGKERLILRVNDRDAEFSSAVGDGDSVDIYWAPRARDQASGREEAP